MKKLLALILCACLALGMAACQPTGTPDPSGDTQATTEPTTEPTTTPTETDPAPTDTEPAPTETEPAPTETEPAPTETEPAPTETEPKPTETEPKPTETEPPATEAPKPYGNLLAHFADGVDTKDKTKTWGWDPENKYIECSKSLECTWGTGGYGKIFLVDGVKTEKVSTLFTQGVWVSCNIKPGWGDFSGELDNTTITWKKGDLDEWLIFDLQAMSTIDKVVFCTLYRNTDHGMPADFTIEVSSDKQNWKTVVTQVGYEQDIASEDQTFTFDAVDCRYVKLHFTKGSTKIDPNLAYCAALSEVEIWGRQK